jgi:hypothetical protein
MKVILIFFTMLCSVTAFTQAKSRTLKKVLELKMPKTIDDDMPGTRGASVAWHPLFKKYYAVMAGNASYPLAVFDANGKRISDDDLVALIDTRGLWYDPITKKICGNAYSNYGWFYYNLNATGIVTGYDNLLDSMHQPDDQSVAAYNSKTKQVLFLYGSELYTYETNGTQMKKNILHIGRTKKQGASGDEDATMTPVGYNTSLVYTGIIGQEIGLLNTEKKTVELYDIQSGFLTSTIALPTNVVLDPDNSFCFAFANSTYWFFNIAKRTWVGYK